MRNGAIRSVIATVAILAGSAFLAKSTSKAYQQMGVSEASLLKNGFPQKRIDAIENNRQMSVFGARDSLAKLADSAETSKLTDMLTSMGNVAKAGMRIKK